MILIVSANPGYVSYDTTDRQKCRFVFSHSDVSCRIQMHGEESDTPLCENNNRHLALFFFDV